VKLASAKGKVQRNIVEFQAFSDNNMMVSTTERARTMFCEP
jgi:hypothetical protein